MKSQPSHTSRLRIACLLALAAAAVACSPKPAPLPPPATQPAASVSFPTRPPSNSITAWKSFPEMHAFYTASFVKNEGFGMRRMFRAEDIDFIRQLNLDDGRYAIASVSLVGMLNEPAPRVYVMHETPTQRGIAMARNRELTPFESAALERLKAGENIVIAEKIDEATRLRPAMASLRAERSCRDCHNVEVGTLLGAFVYSLRQSRLDHNPTPTP